MFSFAKRDGNRALARAPKTTNNMGKIVLRFSDYSLKRVSLTWGLMGATRAVDKTAKPGGMLLGGLILVKTQN